MSTTALPIIARFEDASLGECLLTFDGTTVERFRAVSADAQRMHVAMLTLEVTAPNRKGVREVWCSARANRKGGGFQLRVTDDEWPTVEPVIAAIHATLTT